MHPDTLQGILAKEQREAGLALVETDDHILELRHGSRVIARWLQTAATVEQIQYTAKTFIELEV